MKKLIVILAIMLPMAMKAQFVLTPDGFQSDGKDYYAVEVEGTQSELFNKAKSAITQIYVSAKDAATFSEPTVISLNGFTKGIQIKDGPRTVELDMRYTMKILFKDGKIRFDAPNVLSLSTFNSGRDLSLYLGRGGGPGFNDYGYIFKKDGKVRNEKAVQSLEKYFNTLIQTIVNDIKNPVVDEDW